MKKTLIITLLSCLFLIVLDLVSKSFAYEYLKEVIYIIPSFLFLGYSTNPGIAFSIFIPSILLKVITIGIIATLVYCYFKEYRKKNDTLIDTAFILIISGAIGNGIERLLYGEVTDFIGVRYFSIFNFADTYITLGAMVILYKIFFIKKSYA